MPQGKSAGDALPVPESGREMDALIERAHHGDAEADELAELARWRNASAENERQYHLTVRLLDAGRALGVHDVAGVAPPPTAAVVMARGARGRTRVAATVVRWAPWAIAAAAVVIAAVGLQDYTVDTTEALPAWEGAEVITGAHELATVQLGEGSVVRLGPSSRLRVLTGRERAVRLEGRAYFAVRHVAGRPLRVETPAGEARVLGTRFELATGDDRLHLRVVEGRVALHTMRNAVEVGAGEESEVRNGAAAHPSRAVEAHDATAWRGVFLAFQDTPLGEVAREVERVYQTPVVVADSALLQQTISATFTDRPIREVVNVICSVLDAPCTVGDREVRFGR